MKTRQWFLVGDSSVLGVVILVSSLAGAVGCSRRTPPVVVPVPAAVDTASPWPAILRQVQQLADEGDYAGAERLLGDFAVQHAGTAEGAEADFWRALLRADPQNGQKLMIMPDLPSADGIASQYTPGADSTTFTPPLSIDS